MDATLDIYTCRVQDHRRLHALGIPWLDTTVKTGTSIYAPTWEMVRQYKAGRLSEQQYIEQYRHLMVGCLNRHRTQWYHDMAAQPLVLGCFCPPNTFCHRRLLAQMFVKVALYRQGRHAIYHGEYPLPPKG